MWQTGYGDLESRYIYLLGTTTVVTVPLVDMIFLGGTVVTVKSAIGSRAGIQNNNNTDEVK